MFDYGNEYDDVNSTDGKKVFNGSDSVWFVFVANLYEACQTMFVNREAAGAWSATAYHNFLLSEQQKVPERCWNECYWYDYLRTYEQGISAEWMTFLDGGQKTHQRKHYEYFEELYDASKYRGSTSTSDNINFRAYKPVTWAGVEPKSQITVSMYNKMYISMEAGTTALEPIKAQRGVPYTINFPVDVDVGGTQVAINTASMIEAISGMEQLYPDTCVFSAAVRLRELTIGSTEEGYQNTFLRNLSLSNNTMLERLNVQNLPNANTVLDLSSCPSLSYLDATGSGFTGYDFAVGGVLQTAYIESPTSLTMRSLYHLTDENLHVTSYENIDTLRIEACSGIDSLAIVNAATGLARARLLDIDWTIADTSVLNRLNEIAGINENGNNVPISVLTGVANISGSIRNQELLGYAEAWPNLTVNYNPSNLVTQYLVIFVNDDEEETELYRRYVDQGSTPPDPIETGKIDTPTIASTEQYTFTFDSWDDLNSPVFAPKTIHATYTSTVRTYTVTWYVRPGLQWERKTNILYGSEVNPDKTEFPTWTDGETHHFSLTTQDQLNLITLSAMVSQGAEQVPYHADGELCKFYSVSDMLAIINQATNF